MSETDVYQRLADGETNIQSAAEGCALKPTKLFQQRRNFLTAVTQEENNHEEKKHDSFAFRQTKWTAEVVTF